MLMRQIKYFLAVVDYKSFSEAAEQCYISQSAISQQIRALEDDLGVELIRRENRRFYLTPAGEYFYEHCRKLVVMAEELKRETIQVAAQVKERLRVGYLDNHGSKLVFKTIDVFKRKYPEVKLDLMACKRDNIYELLKNGDIDIALGDFMKNVDTREYVIRWAYMPCYVILSGRNALVNMQTVTIDELRSLPCIIACGDDEYEGKKNYYQKVLGCSNNFLHAENIVKAIMMVVNGEGYLIIDDNYINSEFFYGVVRKVALYNGNNPVTKPYCIFWRKACENAYIKMFLDMARRTLGQDTK